MRLIMFRYDYFWKLQSFHLLNDLNSRNRISVNFEVMSIQVKLANFRNSFHKGVTFDFMYNQELSNGINSVTYLTNIC